MMLVMTVMTVMLLKSRDLVFELRSAALLALDINQIDEQLGTDTHRRTS